MDNQQLSLDRNIFESSTTISEGVHLSSAKWGASKLDEDIVLTTCIYKDVEVHKRTA